MSGFLVFLIALPLCLGISIASNFPPIAGIITAIIGGCIATFLGSAPLTIKGPAAGLIVIALGAVTELGAGDAAVGYKRALAVIVVAGVVQVIFSLVRAGALGDLFPTSVVHGMLAAIGIIIISKQIHVLLGVPVKGDPLELIAMIPHSLVNANPEVVAIGMASLLILFALPMLPWSWAKKIPAPMVVVVVSILLGLAFGLGAEHHYAFAGHDYVIGPKARVTLASPLFQSLTFPDFSQILSGTSIKYIVMFSLVGSIESLLSAKAVDSLDPLRRKSNLDRDLLATGAGNVIAGLIGGLPMISEIVRSSANINNGAKSRMSNFFHGVFLLVFVAGAPALLQLIPLSALAAMLCYTGLRLASPKEFTKTWSIGWEQMLIFCTTLFVTVGVDLLVGVIAGVLMKMILHVMHGLPIRNIFKPHVEMREEGDTTVLRVEHAAVFSNYLAIKNALSRVAPDRKVVVDLCETRIVDHTVMEKLHELEEEYAREGRSFHVLGLEQHKPFSAHPQSARRKAYVKSV